MAEDAALGFVQGFDARYIMLTSENQTNIFSEDEKRMGQSPFLWEFPAKGSSYVLQFIGEWGSNKDCWILLLGMEWKMWRWQDCCHLVLCHDQVCGFSRHRESKPWGVFSNPGVPWPTTILLSKLSLPPLPAKNGGFEYTKKQNQTELAGKKPVAPGKYWWTFSIGWKFLIYFQGHFYF